MKNRLKNYAMWSSFAAFVLLCINMFYPQLTDKANLLVNAFLSLLVAAGIVNNPTTNNKGFSDDKETE